MENKIVNISFIDDNSKNQRYCFFVMPIKNNNVMFLGFRNYNFKKEMSLKTFLSICKKCYYRPDKYIHERNIYTIKEFVYSFVYFNDNSVFFTAMNLIDLKADAKSPIKFKIRSLK